MALEVRLVAGVAGALLSAAVWGLATRMPVVVWTVLATEAASAWLNRRHAEPWWATLSRSIVTGGFWSAVFLLMFDRA